MNLYESCKTPIRIAYFGFALIAVGYLIQNDNVNLFYTFRSNVILFVAELLLKIGEFTIMNLPIIFMLNIVCKRANNASPVVMALVGYFTFEVTTMLFSPQNLSPLAYSGSYGINSVLNMASGTRSPLETGMIGSLLVAYATRTAFIFSRHRGDYSLANLFSRDTSGIIYNFFFCFLLGILVSYTYPYLYLYIQKAVVFIGEDLQDPMRMGMYTVIDRVLSMLGIGNAIRYPFWYTAAGGSYSNAMTGQSILGDVNIWTYIKDSNVSYLGAGRFITPYYVINMFMIPGFYLGTLLSMTDRNERRYLLSTFILGIVLSIIAGNPLPAELLMLFTSPILLLMYLLLTAGVSAALIRFDAFLGFTSHTMNTAVAMPGSFADYIINVRNINLIHSLQIIAIIGAIAFVICLLMTMFYYRFLAFDFFYTGSGSELVSDIVDSVGGIGNISSAGSGLFKLNLSIVDPEKISIDRIQDLGIRRVVETRNGLSFETGTSAAEISRRIQRDLKKQS